jgi:penicillin amidase
LRSAETSGVVASGSGATRGERALIGVRERWIAAAAVFGVAAAFGAWLTSSGRPAPSPEAAEPLSRGGVAVAGLERPVRIDRDRHGVPHIDAASERDAHFALGFCQAQDRLAQLVMLRRRAHGTAAEVIGPDALESDRMARLLDFRGIAERQWPDLPRSARRVLEAYAAGVNARVAQLAVEAGGTATTGAIEPWRAQDSLALFKLFAWGLTASIDASIVLGELVEELGPADSARFFPPQGGSGAGGDRTTAAVAPWVAGGVRDLGGAFGVSGHGVGSTAFVVGGRHTESGRPVLVADSHFEPIFPAALHLAHLRSPDLDIAGATLVGVPVFWWGRNAKLAWAAVNPGFVVTDLYAETLRNGGAEVHDGRRWQPVAESVEAISVRGGADDTLVIRRTARGPLLPAAEGEPEQAIAVAWTGARGGGGSGIASMLRVARAADGDDLREALRAHREPPVALVWAEAAGGAGLQVAGWIPHRRLAAQLLPLPGRARAYAWNEPVAFDSLPSQRLAEGEGFLVAADQRFEPAAGEDAIDSVWRTGARAERLRALLAQGAGRAGDLRSFAALLSDDRLERSVALVDTALSLAGEPLEAQEARELARLLREWDGRASAASVGASVYHVFLDVLAEELFAVRLGKERLARLLALPALDLEALVLGVLRDAAAGGGDVWSEPEAVRKAVIGSLREAWLALSFHHGPDPRRWLWGAMHELRFRALDPSHGSLGPFRYGGAPHAVLASSYSLAHPFAVSVAATARFAVDAGTLDIALTALAPGQSEQPAQPDHRAGLESWLAGGYKLLATRRLEVEELSVAQLVLEPASPKGAQRAQASRSEPKASEGHPTSERSP